MSFCPCFCCPQGVSAVCWSCSQICSGLSAWSLTHSLHLVVYEIEGRIVQNCKTIIIDISGVSCTKCFEQHLRWQSCAEAISLIYHRDCYCSSSKR